MKRSFIAVAASSLLLLTGCSTGSAPKGTDAQIPAPASSTEPDSTYFANQAKINDYIQGCIQYNWEGGDIKKGEEKVFKGITLSGKYDAVEKCFVDASKLNPNRLDLRFGIATAQVAQKKFDQALDTYREIIKVYPQSVQANMLLAAYDRALENNQDEYNKIMANMKQIDAEQAQRYADMFDRTDAVFKTKFNTEAFKMDQPNPAIVVLGYALGEGGIMQETLLHRLEQALAMANANPEAKIIVSGGVPKGGVTESYVMKQWLTEKGVDPSRIMTEDRAKDTVGNAFYSVKLLQQIGSKNVTLITSGTHMRRGLITLSEAANAADWKLESLNNLIYLDKPTVEDAEKLQDNERIFVYRDMMRSSGLWAYPGIHR